MRTADVVLGPCGTLARKRCSWLSGGRSFVGAMVVSSGLALGVVPVQAQLPREGEVRQMVTFTFLPGRGGEAMELYRSEALPLYVEDRAMLAFRAFREVESPVPLDLMVVSSFDGMAGMDASNASLREIAAAAGTSIGSLYGRIGALSTGHTDQFVEMLPALGRGDPSATRLTAFVWYRVQAGRAADFERALAEAARRPGDPPSSTGRFLVADGWDYLRIIGFDSLGEYQAYRNRSREDGALARLSVQRRDVILANLPELAVRGGGG